MDVNNTYSTVKTEETPAPAAPVAPECAAPAPEKPKTYKGLAVTFIILTAFFAVLCVGEYIGFKMAFQNAVAETVAQYEDARQAYTAAHYDITSEQKKWQEELKQKQDEVNAVNEELNVIMLTRQAEWDAEEARWNALTPEQQEAELLCKAYNEMVDDLRKNNAEYAEIYVEMSQYLYQDIFNLGKDASKAYVDLFNRKKAIEQDYLLTHPLNFPN